MKVIANKDGSARIEYSADEHENLLATLRNRVGRDSDVAKVAEDAGSEGATLHFPADYGQSVIEAVGADYPELVVEAE